jgi:MFS superfamily sulfate permease-like transporter
MVMKKLRSVPFTESWDCCVMAVGGTGSLIFSQCLLALRANVKTRVQGYSLGILQLLFLVVPVSAVHYLPNWYFGALLIVIGTDIMFEWLVATYARVKKAEFVLSWVSFLVILALTTVMPVQVRLVFWVFGATLLPLGSAKGYVVRLQ